MKKCIKTKYARTCKTVMSNPNKNKRTMTSGMEISLTLIDDFFKYILFNNSINS